MPQITADPDPVAPGGVVTVCYVDWAPGQIETSVDAMYDFPDGTMQHEQVHLSPSIPCQNVRVPDDALGLLLHDNEGTAEDVAVTVQP